MITAKIIADSINPSGNRLTSWLLTYPRFIHSEFMTHRVFSRNAASSRAIPFSVMMENVLKRPAMPERWTLNQKGMQGEVEMQKTEAEELAMQWELLSAQVTEKVGDLSVHYGAHKSIMNRALEPWAHMTVVATATDHRNFFALRANKDAQPEFQVLAYRMLDEYLNGTPYKASWGDWHIPFLDRELMKPETEGLSWEGQIKIGVARACWASYNKADKSEFIFQDAIDRHDACIRDGHMSPLEHCAQAIHPDHEHGKFKWYPWSNFDYYYYDANKNGMGTYASSHWGQYRKMFDQECKTDVDLNQILREKPAWIALQSSGIQA